MHRARRRAMITLTILAAGALTALLTFTPAAADGNPTTCSFTANASLFSVTGRHGLPNTIYWCVKSSPTNLSADLYGTDPPSSTPIGPVSVGTTTTCGSYTFTLDDTGYYTRYAVVDSGGPDECTTSTMDFDVVP